MGLANWKSELLKIAKSSLEIETDVQSTVMVTSLKEFEAYIRNNYMSSLQVMTDLFTYIFNETKRPANVEQSSSRITDVMNIIRLCRGKGIYSKISEEHIEKILVYCLLQRDYLEFEIEWSKLKTDFGTTEASILGEDDDSEEDVDFEKTISEEVMKGSLEKKEHSW